MGYLLWGAQTHSSNTYLSLSEICFLQFFILSRLWTLSDGDRNLEIMIRCLELISIPRASSSFTTSDIITRKWQRRHRRPSIKVKWAGKPYRQVPSIFSEPGQDSWAFLHPLASNCLLLPFPFMARGSTWTIVCARQMPYPGATQPAYSFHTLMCYRIIPELVEVHRSRQHHFSNPFHPLPMGSLIYGRAPDNSLPPQISCILSCFISCLISLSLEMGPLEY